MYIKGRIKGEKRRRLFVAKEGDKLRGCIRGDWLPSSLSVPFSYIAMFSTFTLFHCSLSYLTIYIHLHCMVTHGAPVNHESCYQLICIPARSPLVRLYLLVDHTADKFNFTFQWELNLCEPPEK